MKIAIIFALVLALVLNQASAVIVQYVQTSTLSPGQEGLIEMEVENILEDDAEDVSLTLIFANLPFIPIGTSELTIDELEENEDENFFFRIKASNKVVPGDYEIPYTLEFKINDVEKSRTGTIGIKVTADTKLSYSVDTKNPIIKQQGQIIFKVINKGFSDARFVSVKVLPEDFTLLSDDEEYIGTIDSNDFETVSFEVIFKETNSDFIAVVEYLDFNNKKKIETVILPLIVYSQERAIELGLMKKDTTPQIIAIAIFLILIWILWRIIRKRRKLKKSQEMKR
jgi:hypothetical protein